MMALTRSHLDNNSAAARQGDAADRTYMLTSDGHAIGGQNSNVLSSVLRPEINLACWQRQIPVKMARAFDAMPADTMPHGRFVSAVPDIPRHLKTVLAVPGINPLVREWLDDDIILLAQHYAALARVEEVEVRIETIRGDACWKFHVDQVAIRLVTTYVGPGTQWIANADAAFAMEHQRDYTGTIHAIPRFAVGAMKGSLILANGAPLVHRSPPISGTGIVRLFVSLNTPPHQHRMGCGCPTAKTLRYVKKSKVNLI